MVRMFQIPGSSPGRQLRRVLAAAALAALACTATGETARRVQSLAEIEALALQGEPGALARRAMAAALREQSVAAAELPDPELMLGAMSLPIDSFDLDQEPMTQIQFGLSQRFPAGDSRRLRSAVMQGRGAELEAEARVRELRVLRALRRAWVEWLYWREADRVAAERDAILAQMRAALQARYAVGQGDQGELLLADIALERNHDRHEMNRERLEVQWTELERWAGGGLEPGESIRAPDWKTRALTGEADLDTLAQRLLDHPEVQSLDHRIAAREQGIELARQAYRPSWGVSLSYGLRDGEDLDGSPRDDFFSAVVSVDLPLFTANRQDRSLKASVHEHEASLAQRVELLRAMRASLGSALASAGRLEQRIERYEEVLLPRGRERAESVQQSYRSANEGFVALTNALDADLELRLDYQRIRRDYLLALVELQYLLPPQTAFSGGANHE